MKCKIFALLAAAALLLCACGQKAPSEPQAPSQTASPETTAAPAIAVEPDASILHTQEFPLDDARTLTLRLIGEEAEYDVRIHQIQVWEDDALLQTISVEDIPDGIGYAQVPSPELAVQARDVNFDGYADLELYGWTPSNAIPYLYWCWDPQSEQFCYAFTLQLQSIDAEAHQLIAWYKVENGLYHTDYYQVDPQNQLILVKQDVEDVRPKD